MNETVREYQDFCIKIMLQMYGESDFADEKMHAVRKGFLRGVLNLYANTYLFRDEYQSIWSATFKQKLKAEEQKLIANNFLISKKAYALLKDGNYKLSQNEQERIYFEHITPNSYMTELVDRLLCRGDADKASSLQNLLKWHKVVAITKAEAREIDKGKWTQKQIEEGRRLSSDNGVDVGDDAFKLKEGDGGHKDTGLAPFRLALLLSNGVEFMLNGHFVERGALLRYFDGKYALKLQEAGAPSKIRGIV